MTHIPVVLRFINRTSASEEEKSKSILHTNKPNLCGLVIFYRRINQLRTLLIHNGDAKIDGALFPVSETLIKIVFAVRRHDNRQRRDGLFIWLERAVATPKLGAGSLENPERTSANFSDRHFSPFFLSMLRRGLTQI